MLGYTSMMRLNTPQTAALGVSLALALWLAPGLGHSKSSLVLPFPPDTGRVPAVTFDTSGQAVGQSEFAFVSEGETRFLMRVDMRIEGGAHNRTSAALERIVVASGETPLLRLLTEQSQSFEADGTPMTLLRVDHESGFASCTPPEGSSEAAAVLALPADDRVANVPMNLLFLPIARGEVERIRFQLFVCRGGAKFHEFVAFAGPGSRGGQGQIIEVRYGPDLGNVMSWVASRVMPRLSFWFDTNRNGAYVAHRMPIYSRGPEIVMIRDGVTPPELGAPF
jgi:hypothetical protein